MMRRDSRMPMYEPVAASCMWANPGEILSIENGIFLHLPAPLTHAIDRYYARIPYASPFLR